MLGTDAAPGLPWEVVPYSDCSGLVYFLCELLHMCGCEHELFEVVAYGNFLSSWMRMVGASPWRQIFEPPLMCPSSFDLVVGGSICVLITWTLHQSLCSFKISSWSAAIQHLPYLSILNLAIKSNLIHWWFQQHFLQEKWSKLKNVYKLVDWIVKGHWNHFVVILHVSSFVGGECPLFITLRPVCKKSNTSCWLVLLPVNWNLVITIFIL